MAGTVLLLAASPAGKGCLVDAAAVLPVLAAVSPPVLSGTDTANVVELADPLEPQVVLTRLRAAATAPGPLTVFITGQLQLDRRQHLPHLALARTTHANIRYTGFPWRWITEELRLRPPGSTSLIVDLHADPETWQYLSAHPLGAGANVNLYGRVAPPLPRRAVGVPAYMKAIGTLLRSGYRPPLLELHQMALGRLASDGVFGDIVLTWEAVASGGGVGTPGNSAPRPPYRPEQPRPQLPDGGGVLVPPVPSPVLAPSPVPSPSPVLAPPAPAVESAVYGGPPSPPPAAPPIRPLALVPDVDTGYQDEPTTVLRKAVAPEALEPAPEPELELELEPEPEPELEPELENEPDSDDDPHAAIAAAVQSDRHADADVIAARHEQLALDAHGPGSEEVLHWTEVRADLAMFSGDAARSCATWLGIADARLEAGQALDHPAVESAVDRAHHQWGRVRDTDQARELGPRMVELRRRVPGRREGALRHVERQLERLSRPEQLTS